jgi:hypothetical protein
MVEITLENIIELLREELKPVNDRLSSVENILTEHTKILNTHTAALVGY